jgi:hypothetical protein
LANPWIDQEALKKELNAFFDKRSWDLRRFGQTVNQTFEAFVFASVIAWYQARGWNVALVHPRDEQTKKQVLKLKFNTRGAPKGYSYARCEKDGHVLQIRHGLRVATRHYVKGVRPLSNICLDVSVLKAADLDGYKSNDQAPNDLLVTFGEAKHMSAFAELIANFIGMVHEVQPERLALQCREKRPEDHLAPFLYVSGTLHGTAEGLYKTIQSRGLDLDVYTQTEALTKVVNLHAIPHETKKKPAKIAIKKPKAATQKSSLPSGPSPPEQNPLDGGKGTVPSKSSPSILSVRRKKK